jgi:hypothetical protein
MEKKGNLFILLCIAHTSTGRLVMQRSMGMTDDKWRNFKSFLKLFNVMEEWFHDSNDKAEVIGARSEIAKVLRSLKTFFLRLDNTNGYNLPKMHGMTKFVKYMMLYGSAMIFYG